MKDVHKKREVKKNLIPPTQRDRRIRGRRQKAWENSGSFELGEFFTLRKISRSYTSFLLLLFSQIASTFITTLLTGASFNTRVRHSTVKSERKINFPRMKKDSDTIKGVAISFPRGRGETVRFVVFFFFLASILHGVLLFTGPAFFGKVNSAVMRDASLSEKIELSLFFGVVWLND